MKLTKTVQTFSAHFCNTLVHVHVAGQFVPQVNLFQPRSICFNLGHFDFCFCFCFCAKKKHFSHLQSSLHPPSSPHLHSTYLTYFSLPAFPTSQPYIYLASLEPQTFGFPLDSCPDALPMSHGDLAASSTIFNRAAMGRARFIIYPWFIYFYFFFLRNQTQTSGSPRPALDHAICNVYSRGQTLFKH